MKIFATTSWIVLGALVLLYPVYINHYPLVFSDSGTYISSGFQNVVPVDRPIIYGLFIRHLSLAESLLLSVLAQALLVSGAIYCCCKYFARSEKQASVAFGISMVLLTLCSGLPWITSWIMPDICSGLSFLFLILLLFGKDISAKNRILFLILYYFTTLSHLSNIVSQLLLIVPLLVIVICLKQSFRDRFLPLRKVAWVTLMVGSNYLLLPSINAAFGGGFQASKGSSVFLSAKLCEHGLLKDYLDHACASYNYKLCPYKDALPDNGPQFLWDYSGPLYKSGGWDNAAELSQINSAILRDPAYLKVFMQSGVQATWQQLQLFEVGHDFIPYDSTSSPYFAITWHLKKDLNAFKNSRQSVGTLQFNFKLLNQLQFIVFVLCLVVSALLIILLPLQQIDLAMLSAYVLLFANAAVCAFLSDLGNRYQLRVIWILFVLTVIQVMVKQDGVKKLWKKQPSA